ncbi:MAG TPA: hypothetical protein VD840_15345, partial [Sinorhizobium sp.]|nr:hypothetical protein [Sinorhizobium sp.]
SRNRSACLALGVFDGDFDRLRKILHRNGRDLVVYALRRARFCATLAAIRMTGRANNNKMERER